MFSNRVQTMLELFNDDKASLTAEMASKQLSSNDELSNKKSDNDKKKHEQEQRKVNLNHLKGYAKNYSLGALTDIKSDLLGEDWEEEHGNVSDGGSSVNSSDSEGTARRKTMRKNYKLENKDADKKPKQKSKSSIF